MAALLKHLFLSALFTHYTSPVLEPSLVCGPLLASPGHSSLLGRCVRSKVHDDDGAQHHQETPHNEAVSSREVSITSKRKKRWHAGSRGGTVEMII